MRIRTAQELKVVLDALSALKQNETLELAVGYEASTALSRVLNCIEPRKPSYELFGYKFKQWRTRVWQFLTKPLFKKVSE